MESNQDQALMRGPPDHRANGPDIPLSGYVVSFSALLTCLSPRNSVRTCALARVEGSVPPTSGFGIRRSPLSYTRILFERVRICTSQRGSIGRVYLTTRPPGLPPSVSPYQSASTYSATAQWYSVRCHCRVSKSFLWAITYPWHTPARCWCHRPPHAARRGIYSRQQEADCRV